MSSRCVMNPTSSASPKHDAKGGRALSWRSLFGPQPEAKRRAPNQAGQGAARARALAAAVPAAVAAATRAGARPAVARQEGGLGLGALPDGRRRLPPIALPLDVHAITPMLSPGVASPTSPTPHFETHFANCLSEGRLPFGGVCLM
jgi:hypothetical protein